MATSATTERLGKYFVMRSKQKSPLVLAIQDGVDKPGEFVVLAEYEEPCVDHQMWYYEPDSGTIRSKLNDFCIDFKDDELIVQPHMKAAPFQEWMATNDRIQIRDNPRMVVGIVDNTPKHHAHCTVKEYCEEEGQHWSIEHCPAQYFYIRSQHDMHKVVDIAGESTKAGTKVIVYDDKGDLADNQLWYEDDAGVLRSKINSFGLHASGDKVTVEPIDGTSTANQWIISGSHVRCKGDLQRVLEYKVGGFLSSDGLVAAQFKDDQPLQNWTFDYIPDHFNSLNHRGDGKYFILRNRASGLIAEVKDKNKAPGTQLVTGYRDRNRSTCTYQLFYTDEVSKTIRSELNYFCVDIVDKQLVMNPFDPYSKTQQWRINGRKIHNREHHNQVWGLSEGGQEPGVSLVAESYDEGNELQQWDKTHIPTATLR